MWCGVFGQQNVEKFFLTLWGLEEFFSSIIIHHVLRVSLISFFRKLLSQIEGVLNLVFTREVSESGAEDLIF
jgi:hypothetical protein